jgi:hypothetical protein
MNDVSNLLKMAFECSVYAAPREPGLTKLEVGEVAQRLELLPGEVSDTLPTMVRPMRPGETRLLCKDRLVDFNFFAEEEPDYRNPDAFEFVLVHLHELVRQVGEAKAWTARTSIVANGVARGLPEHDVDVAVTSYWLDGRLEEKNGELRLTRSGRGYALPSQQIAQRSPDDKRFRSKLGEVHRVVKDVVSHRNDGRVIHAEPLDALGAVLEKLGHGEFQVWWAQTVAELRRANAMAAPLSTCVLSAALCEAALIFVVARARTLGVGAFASNTFSGNPNRWRLDDLAASAAGGGLDAILDQPTRGRAERLNGIRQRIHVGRLMAGKPAGPIPDTRPEEAREAAETADTVVRAVLDWVEKHPAS